MVGVMVLCLPASYADAASRGGLVGYWPFDGDTKDKSGSGMMPLPLTVRRLCRV